MLNMNLSSVTKWNSYYSEILKTLVGETFTMETTFTIETI